MLRITVQEVEDALFVVLEGRLVGPWVDELRNLWQQHATAQAPQQLTVDLCGLAAMDSRGQDLLDELLQRGATLRCSDVMNQYLVEQMGGTSGPLREASRPCQGFPGNSTSPARATLSGSPAKESTDAA